MVESAVLKTKADKYIEELNNGDGFFTFKLDDSDLLNAQEIVSNHWKNHIREAAPDKYNEFEKLKIQHYHQKASLLDHNTFWPRTSRILSNKGLNQFKQLPLYDKLTSIFGPFGISMKNCTGDWAENYNNDEEIFWRIVRPHENNDIGPLHLDKWFWDLGNGTIPENTTRIKVWVSLFCNNTNGLRLVPKSQLQTYSYKGECRHNIMKPVFNESDYDLDIQNLDCSNGTVIVFHDELMHGGTKNLSSESRVSLEFTMLVQKTI